MIKLSSKCEFGLIYHNCTILKGKAARICLTLHGQYLQTLPLVIQPPRNVKIKQNVILHHYKQPI